MMQRSKVGLTLMAVVFSALAAGCARSGGTAAGPGVTVASVEQSSPFGKADGMGTSISDNGNLIIQGFKPGAGVSGFLLYITKVERIDGAIRCDCLTEGVPHFTMIVKDAYPGQSRIWDLWQKNYGASIKFGLDPAKGDPYSTVLTLFP